MVAQQHAIIPTPLEKAQMLFSIHNALWVAVTGHGYVLVCDKKKIVDMWETAVNVYLKTGKSAYNEFKTLITCCLIFVFAL